jgi:hypothetical protein
VKIAIGKLIRYKFPGTDQILAEQNYGLDDWSTRVQFLVGAGNFSLHHHIQNGSETNPASYPMGTRGSVPGGKAARV